MLSSACTSLIFILHTARKRLQFAESYRDPSESKTQTRLLHTSLCSLKATNVQRRGSCPSPRRCRSAAPRGSGPGEGGGGRAEPPAAEAQRRDSGRDSAHLHGRRLRPTKARGSPRDTRSQRPGGAPGAGHHPGHPLPQPGITLGTPPPLLQPWQ